MEFQPEILYEDRYIAVCVKPVGYLSEPGGKSLPDALSRWYAQKGENSRIFTVHRLDQITGGVMVFSRDRGVTGALTKAVAEHRFQQEYLAVLRGIPEEPEAVLEDLLFRDSARNKTYVVSRMRKGVRQASLQYTLKATAETEGVPVSLVQVLLHTGRTHQIRAQFSSRGLPLLGDIRYGSKDPRCTAALWAWRLRFPHPVSGQTVEVTAPPPKAYPWTLFP